MREIQAVRRGIRKSSLLAAAAVLCSPPLSVRLFAQGSDAAWRVDSPPSTMALSEIKHGAGKTVFVLENVSGKRIAAYSLSHGDVTHTTDYFETGNDLAPNAYDELVIGDDELQSATERVLRLTAVVFTDGTTVGGQDPIDFIVGARLGVTTETERIAGILGSPADARADDRSVDALVARMGDLPQTPGEAFAAEREVHIAGVDLGALSASKGKSFAHAFLSGVRNARETARWRVSQLHQIPLVAKNPHVPDRASALSQLRQSYDDLAARNKTLLTQQGGVR
jgi:hypothetical protein